MGVFLKKISIILFFTLCVHALAYMPCTGTVYFKLPESWSGAYAFAAGQYTPFSESVYKGWLQLDVSLIGTVNQIFYFDIQEKVDSTIVDSMLVVDTTNFSCKDFGDAGELWIQWNESDNSFSRSSTPPGAKVFHVFLPNTDLWKNSIPMLSVDGKTGEPMSMDPNRCGWYYKRFIDKEPPSSVAIYRDDDEKMENAVGMGGDWDEFVSPTPIDLRSLFDLFGSSDLYFVADGEFADASNPDAMGWTATDPVDVKGNCGFDLSALIYDTDASLHGAFVCSPNWNASIDGTDAMSYNACYYSSAKYNVVSSDSQVVPCIGMTQGMVNVELDNETRKPTLTNAGKQCFGDQADEAFAAMFSSTEGVNETSCFDIPFYRNVDGRYEFNSDNYQSRGTAAVGGFYPVELDTGRKFLSERLPAAQSKRKAEGPVFFCSDFTDLDSKTSDGLRTIDENEGVQVNRLICNGPGWNGGIDCNGLFASGSEFGTSTGLTAAGQAIQDAFGVTWTSDGWGWSCPMSAPVGWAYYKEGTETFMGRIVAKNQSPAGATPRWTSGISDSEILDSAGRNQHFCMESHASFRYRKGLRLSYMGTDDAWIFIDNKLAVDAGGIHLPAPGYVDLDKFVGTSGSWEIGETYPIDIFSCSRRTTMTTFSINTNMYIQQVRAGLALTVSKSKGGAREYKIRYSSVNPCEAIAVGDTTPVEDLCKYLASEGTRLEYAIMARNGDVVMTPEELSQDIVYLDGIDLTNRCEPKINLEKITWLRPGKYYLVVSYKGITESIPFKVADDSESAIPVPHTDSGKSGFHAVPVGPSSLDIVLEKASLVKPYVVMDLMGGVVARGNAAAGVTRVSVKNRGVYVVRVADELQKVNVK